MLHFRRPSPPSCGMPARPRSRRRPRRTKMPCSRPWTVLLGRCAATAIGLRRPDSAKFRHLTAEGTAVMVDDRPEDTGSLPDSERPKRAPPTIDLEATDVSTATRMPTAPPMPMTPPKPNPAPNPPPSRLRRRRCRRRLRADFRADFSLDRRAGLRRGRRRAGDRRRLDAGLARGSAGRHAAGAAVNAAAIDDLTARVAGLESKVGKPVADPAAAARVEGLEKSLAALRSELAATARKATSSPPRSMT